MNRKTTTFYKLKHAFDETKEFYIGSPDNYNQRVWQHRYGSSPQPKLYRYIARNGGFDSWTFEVLEEHNSMDKYDRYRKEAQLIEHHKATLNTFYPIQRWLMLQTNGNKYADGVAVSCQYTRRVNPR